MPADAAASAMTAWKIFTGNPQTGRREVLHTGINAILLTFGLGICGNNAHQ
jgi:hypothetical protein